jgi:hypothetical protein
MHRKVKVLISRWLASRIETRTRRLRRALRDQWRLEIEPRALERVLSDILQRTFPLFPRYP